MRIIVSRRFHRRWKGCHCNGGFALLYSTYRGTRLKDCQVSLWYPRADIYLADAAAIKVRYTLARTGCIQFLLFLQEVASSRARSPKPVKMYEMLLVFGWNIIASKRQEWKRRRVIAAPAFSEVRNGCRCSSFSQYDP